MGRFRQLLQALLQVNDTPARIALAFSIGLFVAFSPMLGIHTGLSLLIAFVFRLSRVAILLGTWTNNPWTIAPMYAAGTFLGCVLLGVAPTDFSALDWSDRATLWRVLRPYLWPFIVGNTVLGVVSAWAAYYPLKAYLERRKAADETPRATASGR
jgi:uncharacterized protein (DUF2062 family)